MIVVETVSTRAEENGDLNLVFTEFERRFPSMKPDTPTCIQMSRELATELRDQLDLVLEILAASAPLTGGAE